MTQDEPRDDVFDSRFWNEHWSRDDRTAQMALADPNPYLIQEIEHLFAGTALDAGCGAGAEAMWLASNGWRVTAVDISPVALEHARHRARAGGLSDRIDWVAADITTWMPPQQFDLVTTHYAHTTMPQLDLFHRLARFVAPGGTLLIVGHQHGSVGGASHQHGQAADPHQHGSSCVGESDEGQHATVDAATITRQLPDQDWDIITARHAVRDTGRHGGATTTLHDVVVRARRHE